MFVVLVTAEVHSDMSSHSPFPWCSRSVVGRTYPVGTFPCFDVGISPRWRAWPTRGFNAYDNIYRSRPPGVPHSVVLIPTMTLNSTGDSLSIFKDGKLKPGIYKIQNIYTETYIDIEVHTRHLFCRPANDLGEGKGLVSRYPLFVVRV